jgi:hypothetical protein
MKDKGLNIVQELLLKKRLRDELLIEAGYKRLEEKAAGIRRPTFIYSGFKRVWHVVFH